MLIHDIWVSLSWCKIGNWFRWNVNEEINLGCARRDFQSSPVNDDGRHSIVIGDCCDLRIRRTNACIIIMKKKIFCYTIWAQHIYKSACNSPNDGNWIWEKQKKVLAALFLSRFFVGFSCRSCECGDRRIEWDINIKIHNNKKPRSSLLLAHWLNGRQGVKGFAHAQNETKNRRKRKIRMKRRTEQKRRPIDGRREMVAWKWERTGWRTEGKVHTASK